jgi:hypothetical protein
MAFDFPLACLVDKFITKAVFHLAGENTDSAKIEEMKQELGAIWQSCVKSISVSVSWSDSGEVQTKKKKKEKVVEEETVAEESEDSKCVYVPTRGKSKGVACGKKSLPGKKMCASHKKMEDDEKVVEEEDDKSVPEENGDSGLCTFVPKSGKTKGVPCTNNVVEGYVVCSKHLVKTKAPETMEDKKSDTKVQLVKKQNGRWVHVESGFVFKSTKERVVIGKMVNGEFSPLVDGDITEASRLGFECEQSTA